jgi:hypothetical protein
MAANKQMYFNDGEAIEYTDFNKMVSFIQKSFSDIQYFSRCAEIDSVYEGDTAAFTSGGSDVSFSTKLFVLDETWRLYTSSLTSATTVLPPGTGIIAAGNGIPTGLADDVRTMLPIQLAQSSAGVGIPASSPFQWQLVTISVEPSETLGDSTTRDFEDAVTGALSSTSVNKSKIINQPTKTLTTGTAGGGIPAIPAGHIPICALKVADSSPYLSFDGAVDYTFPCSVGAVNSPSTIALSDANGDWNMFSGRTGHYANSLGTASLADVAHFYPAAFTGNAAARLLRLDIAYKCLSAVNFTCTLVRVDANGSVTTLETITGFTRDDTWRSKAVLGSALSLPYWGNGYSAGNFHSQLRGHANFAVEDKNASLALRIVPDGGSDAASLVRFSVNWSFAV